LRRAYAKTNHACLRVRCFQQDVNNPEKKLAGFLYALRTFSKDCNFVSVTALEYQEETTCNAFISGIASTSIRQRLLKYEDLNLKAFDLPLYSVQK